jgi:hypothetical protein
MSKSFGDIKVKNGEVKGKGGGGPLSGAHATVDFGGAIDRRLSLTRVALTGGLGLFWKKKVDKRETYLLVEGEGFALMEQVDPKKTKDAQEFAAWLNNESAKATAGSRSSGTAAVSTNQGGLADEIAKLAALRDSGVLSEEEFVAQKAKLLG